MFHVETDVRVTYRDGQVLVPLQGQHVDLMKLDTVQEFRTIFQAIASEAVAASFAAPAEQQPPTVPQSATGVPDFSAAAEKIGESFQRLAQQSEERLAKFAELSGVGHEGETKADG